jgi:hypothetical protein
MNSQLRVSACQRMGNALDETGNLKYKHIHT